MNKYWGKVLFCGLVALFVLGGAPPEVQAARAGRNSPAASVIITPSLFPAYVADGSVKQWGYINRQGKFQITPRYEWVYDYEPNGLARVMEKGKVGVINGKGRYLFEPVYQSVTPFSGGVAVAFDGKIYQVLHESGKVIYRSEDYVGPFSEGLAVIRKITPQKQRLYGYIDARGQTVIEPQFSFASDFRQQRAIVQSVSGQYQIIDREGRVLLESDLPPQEAAGGIVTLRYGDDEFGYKALTGTELFPGRFYYAGPFEDDLAIVNISPNYMRPQYGVINKEGNYAIEPEYARIQSIGGGLFAVSSRGMGAGGDTFSPKAIFDGNGKQLTDFRYFEIGNFSQNVVPVSEDHVTYFLNKNGEKIDDLPQLAGVGVVIVQGDVIKANIDDDLMYLTKSGKVIWQAATEWNLAGSLLRTFKYRPDRAMLIKYPQVLEHKDPIVRDLLNGQLKALFVGDQPVSPQEDGMYTASATVNFSLRQQQDLLIIEKNGYYYPVGAAHGMPSRQYYHFNFKTGRRYYLADLFQPDSDYQDAITQRINSMISTASEQKLYYGEQLESIRPDQEFSVTETGLKVIFQPYEIAPYAAGFPEFVIPWGELMDMVDATGGFWKAFRN
ncbi:WG repeat-containing protein [Acetonema longum]|uniref:DUF3298 domain-containing protein n=1 Tax=Acetonema longum DSM 6540 TaxID=1009370 RepID=F7NDL0_9FIRM|nr:WG repeat-containing protein [Acetonema longum]EGO65872.1 hypothetical protein ALO_00585 [Acetonema longum DSM 6540]